MKINYIAATAAVMPAAIAGLALAGGAPAQAGTSQSARTDAASTSSQAQQSQARQAHAQKASASTRVWVTVKAGNTLSGIAAAHHTTWQAVYATPPNTRVLHDPNLLIVGERLRIPADPTLRQAQFEAKYAASLAAAAQQAPASSPASATSRPAAQAQPAEASGAAVTAGESSFEQCVAYRESSDTPTDPDGLFGILPSTWASLGYSGTAGEASVAVQKEAFSKLYAEDGAEPWAPYDGC